MQRRMVVFRPPGTRDLIIHSCIAVDEATLSAIVGHGKPTVLIVPNSFHRSDAAVWKARFPQLVVACPAGSRDAVAKIVAVDMDAIALPQRYPHLIHAYSLPGVTARGKQPFELVFEFAVSPVPAAGRWASTTFCPSWRHSHSRCVPSRRRSRHALLRAQRGLII